MYIVSAPTGMEYLTADRDKAVAFAEQISRKIRGAVILSNDSEVYMYINGKRMVLENESNRNSQIPLYIEEDW